MTDKNIKEEWRPVSGYEGYYEVSNIGRVRSITRNVKHTSKKGGISLMPRYGKEKTLTQTVRGYVTVRLSRGGRNKNSYVHRVVAEAFLPNPSKLPQVNHKDGVKPNNHVNNLEWCDASYNSKHKFRVLKVENPCKGRTGKNNPASKPVIQLNEKREFIAEFESSADASRSTGVNHRSILLCANEKYNIAGGFIWKFKKQL